MLNIKTHNNFGFASAIRTEKIAKKTTFFLKKSAIFRHFFEMFVIFYIKVKGLITKDLTFEIVATISEFN
jgi:hypothetical protein